MTDIPAIPPDNGSPEDGPEREENPQPVLAVPPILDTPDVADIEAVPMVNVDKTVRACLLFLCFVAGTATLYVTRDILAPLALAVFFWLIIDAFARWIDGLSRHIPYWVGLSAALLVTVMALVGLALIVVDTATNIAEDSDRYAARVGEIVAWIGGLTGGELNLTTLSEQLDIEGQLRRFLGVFAAAVQAVLADSILIAIYITFLFVAQRSFPKKLDDMISGREARQRTGAMFDRMGHSIETYLSVQTIVSLIQTVLSFGIMLAFGLENALFWALVIFILNYIPLIGGVAAGLLPALFALVQFDSMTAVAAMTGLLFAVQFLIANTLQPKMMGDSMNLSALVVVLSLVLWGALWGGVGAFLSAPLTVVIMVVLAQFQTTRWIAVMLSADGQPDLDPYEKKRNKAAPSL